MKYSDEKILSLVILFLCLIVLTGEMRPGVVAAAPEENISTESEAEKFTGSIPDSLGRIRYVTPEAREAARTEWKKDYSHVDGLLNVPLICQFPDFTYGCESVSAVMVLQYYGQNISTDMFVDVYLDKCPMPSYRNGRNYIAKSPNDAFLGDPRSDGFGIFLPGLQKAVDKVLRGTKLSTYLCQGISLDELCKTFIAGGTPVIIAASQNMDEVYKNCDLTVTGTDEAVTWYSPYHVLVLVGYDAVFYYFNDPATGEIEAYSRESSETAYAAMGSCALVIK